MFYNVGNALDMFVRPEGNTQWVWWTKLSIDLNENFRLLTSIWFCSAVYPEGDGIPTGTFEAGSYKQKIYLL